MQKCLSWSKDKCLLCSGCMAVCPPGNVITVYETRLEIKHENCIKCRRCVKVCPMGALSLGNADGVGDD